jgi:hypothetical protein
LSLALESGSPEILEANLLASLQKIAPAAKLGDKVSGPTSGKNFKSLIRTLSQESKAKIAALIDDIDAPVTANLANLRLAEGDSKIIRQFLDPLISASNQQFIGFTLVAGATNFPLALPKRSWPAHLKNTSSRPQYSGLVGFDLTEFASLFGDRMEETLASLQKSGQMDRSATTLDLREKIFPWYGGYAWTGEFWALNPFSTLKFFPREKFDLYWSSNIWPTPPRA